ncbi:hypothetical protein C8T65DRAFT_737979 [Cerioporus squamosus]|nr:hypothetical protein C8T65DRAFT_737979 [Cerioporus squamosus]
MGALYTVEASSYAKEDEGEDGQLGEGKPRNSKPCGKDRSTNSARKTLSFARGRPEGEMRSTLDADADEWHGFGQDASDARPSTLETFSLLSGTQIKYGSVISSPGLAIAQQTAALRGTASAQPPASSESRHGLPRQRGEHRVGLPSVQHPAPVASVPASRDQCQAKLE